MGPPITKLIMNRVGKNVVYHVFVRVCVRGVVGVSDGGRGPTSHKISDEPCLEKYFISCFCVGSTK